MTWTVTMLGLPGVVIGNDPDGRVAVQILNAGVTIIDHGGGEPGEPGGATTFLGLTDTPGSYAEQAGKGLRVNASRTALEFVDLVSTAAFSAVVTTVNNQGDAIDAIGNGLGTLSSAVGTLDSAVGEVINDVEGLSGIVGQQGSQIEDLVSDLAAHESDNEAHGISAYGSSIVSAADAAAARTALGLGGAAVLGVGTTAGTVAAGDDARLGVLPPLKFEVDAGAAVVGAVVRRAEIVRDCTITRATLVTAAGISGSVVVTIKRDRGGTVTTMGTITLTADDFVVQDISGWTAVDFEVGDFAIAEGAAGTTLTWYKAALELEAA